MLDMQSYEKALLEIQQQFQVLIDAIISKRDQIVNELSNTKNSAGKNPFLWWSFLMKACFSVKNAKATWNQPIEQRSTCHETGIGERNDEMAQPFGILWDAWNIDERFQTGV